MPRVGSSSSTAAGGARRQHHLEREPLALASGEVARVVPLAACEAGSRHARRAGVLHRVLVDQVVARVLQQRATSPARSAVPRVGTARPLATRRSVLLPAPLRPISATRSPAARSSVIHAGRLGRPRSRATHPAAGVRARAPLRLRRPRPAGAGRRVPVASPDRPGADRAFERRAPRSPLPAAAAGRPARTIGPPEWRAPARLGGPLEEPGRRCITGHAPSTSAITRSAAGRQRSSRCSAITTAVPSPRLAAAAARPARHRPPDRAARWARRAAAGAGVHHRGGDRHALQLAARERRCAAPAGERLPARARSPPPSAPRRPRATTVLRGAARAQPRTPPITTWVSGSWNTVPQIAASSPGPWSRTSSPPTRAPRRLAAVKVRDEATEGPQKGRLR